MCLSLEQCLQETVHSSITHTQPPTTKLSIKNVYAALPKSPIQPKIINNVCKMLH